MTNNSIVKIIERMLNALEISGIILVLFMAFAFQIILHELPCPLCLLQRFGFLGVAFGFLLNLRFGLRPSHYAIALASAIFTSFVALRQVALHVVPGTGVYGDAILGLHLYSWSLIISMIIVVATTLMLGVDRQYQSPPSTSVSMSWITSILFGIVLFIVLANVFSVAFECGLAQCPDNPTHYL